jgi:uncharacterized protein involved in exopolysaccharide biosynthesis
MRRSLRDLLHVAFRHKGKMALAFVTILSLVTLYTYLSPEIYRSEAKVLIRLGRESLAVDPSVSGPTLHQARERTNEVNSEIAIITSRLIAEQVVNELGPDLILDKPDEEVEVTPPTLAMAGAQQDLRALRREVRDTEEAGLNLLVALDLATPLTPFEEAVKYLLENLTVEVESKTDIISLAFESPRRDVAQRALDALVHRYLEHHIEVHSSQATPEFFEEQTETLRHALEEREEELNRFRREHGIAKLDQQKDVLLQQISGLELKLAETIAELDASNVRVEELEKTLAGRSAVLEISRTTGVTNYAADAMKERLLELRLQETDLAARYPETHRPLVDVRKQIAEAEAALAKENETHTEVTTGIDASYQQIQLALENERADAAAFDAHADVINAELAAQRVQLEMLSAREVELVRLEREVKLAEAEYEQYREGWQRAKISSALDVDKVSNVSIVQPASQPMDPVRPKKLLNIALGIFLALFGSLTFAILIEYFDDRVNTPEDVKRHIGVPVLIVVSDKEYASCTSNSTV